MQESSVYSYQKFNTRRSVRLNESVCKENLFFPVSNKTRCSKSNKRAEESCFRGIVHGQKDKAKYIFNWILTGGKCHRLGWISAKLHLYNLTHHEVLPTCTDRHTYLWVWQDTCRLFTESYRRAAQNSSFG